MEKTVEYYMSLPYTIESTPDARVGGWVISVKELEGCWSQADEWEDVLPHIREAMEGWFAAALEIGQSIPEPEPVAF